MFQGASGEASDEQISADQKLALELLAQEEAAAAEQRRLEELAASEKLLQQQERVKREEEKKRQEAEYEEALAQVPPCISLHLLASPCISLHLPASPLLPIVTRRLWLRRRSNRGGGTRQ